MDEKEKYMRWLEKMWEVGKFDLLGRMEREEKRKDEVLEMFAHLGELSRQSVEVPASPPWERSPW